MEEFLRRRAADQEALECLTLTEQATVKDDYIHIKPLEIEEESAETRYRFLARLHHLQNPLSREFAALDASGISFSTQIDFKSYYGYKDVFQIDERFLGGPPPGYEAQLLSVPSGWIWVFWNTTTSYLGMIGIRISLVEFCKKRRGIASQLLERVIQEAQIRKKSQILVPNPLWGMRSLLLKRGFVRHERLDPCAEREFLHPIQPCTVLYELAAWRTAAEEAPRESSGMERDSASQIHTSDGDTRLAHPPSKDPA